MKRRIGRLLDAAVGGKGGVVLLYHRVADPATDPQLLAVSPRNFGQHLEIMSRDYAPRDLGSVARRSARSEDRRGVAVTFDDGYADNQHAALPLLRAATVPATIFVVAGQVGIAEEFWWDDLERILLTTLTLPENLELTVGSEVFHWVLGSDPGGSDPSWNVLSNRVPSARQVIYQELCDIVRPLSFADRGQVLRHLRAWAGVGDAGRAENRALSTEELRELAHDDLVSIGAHTTSHALLAARPVAEQNDEIRSSKRILEEILVSPIESFAYPFGGGGQYTESTVQLVKEAGFGYACANIPGLVRRSTPRYELPRFLVRDWTGDEFAERLEAFIDG